MFSCSFVSSRLIFLLINWGTKMDNTVRIKHWNSLIGYKINNLRVRWTPGTICRFSFAHIYVYIIFTASSTSRCLETSRYFHLTANNRHRTKYSVTEKAFRYCLVDRNLCAMQLRLDFSDFRVDLSKRKEIRLFVEDRHYTVHYDHWLWFIGGYSE